MRLVASTTRLVASWNGRSELVAVPMEPASKDSDLAWTGRNLPF